MEVHTDTPEVEYIPGVCPDCGGKDVLGGHTKECTLAVPVEDERAIEEEICRIDRVERITRHFWIKRKNGAVTLLNPLKPSQKKLLNLIRWLRKREQPVRIIILKARKTGISTVVEADMFCEVLDREIDGVVIAHELDLAKYIFAMSQMFYDRYDLTKPKIKRGNVKELTFFEHHGRLMVTTANNKMAGTGMTPQYIHATEVPKWEIGSQTAVSLLQSVGNESGTSVIWEGTAYGYDELFYPTWKDAYENCKVEFNRDCSIRNVEVTNPKHWNYYYPLFISVFDDPDCRMEFATEQEKEGVLQTLDEYERYLIDSGTADAEYVKYRRYTLKNQCQNDLDIYHQEHSETPEQSFIASGRPRFNRGALASMPIEEGRRGLLKIVPKGWEDKIEFTEDPQEMLMVYRTPQYGHRYVIGVDTAEGKIPEGCKKPDASVAIVVDKDENCREVAALYGQISEENMVPYIALLAKWYNTAFLVIEINWGGAVIPSRLMGPEFRYPPDRFFHIDDWKDGKSNRSAGWKTTVATRNNLIADLAEFIQQKCVIVHDRKTLEELNNFVWKDAGRVEAQKGFHDDHCFALGLAVQGVKHYPNFSMSDPVMVRRMAELREAKRRTADAVTGY